MTVEIVIMVAAFSLIVATYFLMNRKLGGVTQAFHDERQRLSHELASASARADHLVREQTKISADSAELMRELSQVRERHAALTATNEILVKTKGESEAVFKTRNFDLEKKLETVRAEKQDLSDLVSRFEAKKEEQESTLHQRMSVMQNILESHQREKEQLRLVEERAAAEALRRLDETWQRHEISVEERMKLICQRQGLEYVTKEKFPYKGKPDNCIAICGEHIVFDSKSPAGAELANFPNYIKREADGAKKYAVDGVKKDIYLVVPTNAVHVIKDTFLDMAKYRVHVITPDAIEPILLSLKKIEEYEFAEKLNPEDREKIVTTLGKFAHNMKRKVQIDQFMANETIALLMDAEKLPGDILADAQKVERSSMLNPPQERRNKMIATPDLAKESQKLNSKGAGQEIQMELKANFLTSVPLHKETAEAD